MSFDKIFDLTAGVHFFVIISCDTALLEVVHDINVKKQTGI